MTLTRHYEETIRARVQRDAGFRALLREGIENFLSGDVETWKIILRDFINAQWGRSGTKRNHASFCIELDANARAAR